MIIRITINIKKTVTWTEIFETPLIILSTFLPKSYKCGVRKISMLLPQMIFGLKPHPSGNSSQAPWLPLTILDKLRISIDHGVGMDIYVELHNTG